MMGNSRKTNDPLANERAKANLVKIHVQRHIFSNSPALFQGPIFLVQNRHKLPIAVRLSPALSDGLMTNKSPSLQICSDRKKKNDGELPQYHIENSHPAIVTKEQWDLVQVELERRSRMPGRFSPKGPLGSRLVCADCGGFFGAKTWHSSDPLQDCHLAVQ